MARGRRKPTQSLTLRPADPFDLIRWLARSQSDPRKAVAELVQNSLDAGARQIMVTRVRKKGALCLVVHDDGEGVLPGRPRDEALRHLATHVGHSHKLGLDPRERMRRVVAGKYGVGLLGFWAIGRVMELRSRVAGSPLVVLELREDSPRAEVYELPLPTDATDTFTEVVVRDVHETAQRSLGGRRLADYLAAELRGQLLSREVGLVVHDGVARGTAQKHFEVKPRRYTGERLELPAEIEVGGFPPLRVELYVRGAERAAIQIACAGTLVADDIAELGALGLAEPPWVGRDLSGLIDFAGFSVPPGTRRGVMPDRAAAAFADALERLAPRVEVELARFEQQRQAEAARDVVRDLRRALRGLGRRLPQYELPRVVGQGEPARGPGPERGGAAEAAPHEAGAAPVTDDRAASDDAASAEPVPAQVELLAPGPLAAVRIVPSEVRVAPGAEHRVRAVATDASQRRMPDARLRWHFVRTAPGIELRGDSAATAVYATPTATLGSEAELRVEATLDAVTVHATARVRVDEVAVHDAAALGIPEPVLVSDPSASWRSRLLGERWEINDAHEDYRALRAEPRARLRYLLALLGKELVARAHGFEHVQALDALVEVLAHAERNLRGG